MMNVLQMRRALLLLCFMLSVQCAFSQSQNLGDWSISANNLSDGRLVMGSGETRTITYSVTIIRAPVDGGWAPVNLQFQLQRQPSGFSGCGCTAVGNIQTISSSDFDSNSGSVTKNFTASVTAQSGSSSSGSALRNGDKLVLVFPSSSWSPPKYFSVTVNLPAIGNNTISANGGPTSFYNSGDPNLIVGSAPTGGAGAPYTYKWQKSTTSASSGFNDIASTNVQSYDPLTISQTTWYQRIASSGGQSSTSSPLQFTISTEPLSNNTIINTGTGTFTDSGDPALLSGSAPTGGAGNYKYQWQSANLADPSNFVDITDATEQNYNPPITDITTYFRRKVTSGDASINSNIITVDIMRTGATISNPINIGNFDICSQYSALGRNLPIYGYGSEWGNNTDDIFYKFNLTAKAKVTLANCKSDGVSGKIALLYASGETVFGGIPLENCDVGGQAQYTLQPGVYYIVSESGGTSDDTNYLPLYLVAEPIVTVSPEATTILAGTSTTLSIASENELTYQWRPAAGLNTTTGATVIASPAVTTTYVVIATSPNGCTLTRGITVNVTGSVGSTINNPIDINIGGCGFNTGTVVKNPTGYGNEYGTPGEDIYFRFTLTSASPVRVEPAIDYMVPLHLAILNSTGGLVTEKYYKWVDSGDDAGTYDLVPEDRIPFTPTLQAGTYYFVMEGTASNPQFMVIDLDTPAGYGCRKVTQATKDAPITNNTADNTETADAISGSDVSTAIIYPNPAKDLITVMLDADDAAIINFVNVNGVTVKQASTVGKTATVNISDLPTGLYLLKISQGGRIYNKKLLIEP